MKGGSVTLKNSQKNISNSMKDLGISSPLMEMGQTVFMTNHNDLHTLIQESRNGIEPTLESLSFWLSQTIPVKLVAYWNPRTRRSGLYCQNGEVTEPLLLEKSRAIMEGPLPRIRHWRQENWMFHLWMGLPLDKWDRILIVESGTGMTIEESNALMDKALEILQEPLKNECRINN